ncbi:MAG: elongation factor G [Betaproteobacteria bacterium]|nr:elongation factor G [Betaproteobacteria bacterium]
MPKFATESIRTLALVGHAGSGKTTLAEALLHKAGAVGAPGSVERGTTVSDFDALEKEHGHSLNSSVLHLEHGNTRVHFIDTPGSPDMVGQALCALDAAETAAVVINAQNGIELVTSRMMQWAARRNLCRLIVVNRIDAENVDLEGLLERIKQTFGKECIALNLPAGGGTRVVDCFFNPAGESDFSSVEETHQHLIDQVVEVDEELMAVYLEKGEVSPEQLHAPFEKALRDGHLVPVCFVSARNGAGIAELLDIFVKLLPNPAEGNPPLFVKGEGAAAEEFPSEPDARKHVLAHVFKVSIDPFVGRLGIFRIHQGTITKDTQLYIGEGKKPFKVAHPLMIQGKDMVEVDALVPGDIGAVAKVEEVVFDAVLHDSHDEDHIHLKPLEFPTPVYGLAIHPQRRGDEQRLSGILQKLEAEDPCFRVEHVATTNETIIRGLGELHLRFVLEKMASQYHIEVTTKPPSIPYRETITARAEGHHRHKKQTGGAGQFGEVYLKVEPLPRGAGFEFVDEVRGGTIPNQFIPAVEKGVRQVLEAGPLAGYPMMDMRVIVYDGKHHPVDSKEVAFIAAGKKAFIDAITKARPIVLEPIVNIEITTPEHCMGDVTGDLSSKRGQVAGTQSAAPGMLAISGRVPLSELNNYQSKLKSVTGGHGSYSLEFSHYEPVPPTVQTQLVSQYKAHRTEEQ